MQQPFQHQVKPIPEKTRDQVRKGLFSQLNEHRSLCKKPKLNWDQEASECAQELVERMVGMQEQSALRDW
jgi:uncharacterized protein YkwD